MFGIGLPEMIVISAVALIVVGPDKLPELAKSLAKGLLELKKTVQQFKENLTEEEETIKEVQKELYRAADDLKGHILEHDPSPQLLPERPPPPEPEARASEDIIEMDTAERPWESDAQAPPAAEHQHSRQEENRPGADISPTPSTGHRHGDGRS
ncbi:MAG: hypothetical protein CSA33_03615 [Desulfobulbus propionicus]|nr:MAG: hypothetical protein CSA33_03615 [Desulfobulbus propionicus]